jgi:Bacterial toxin homologue of phage lysozyme, C-term
LVQVAANDAIGGLIQNNGVPSTGPGAPAADAGSTAAPNVIPAKPAGVDWSFVTAREEERLDGYVPMYPDGSVIGNSGVTIAAGFDLGAQSAEQLRQMGIPEDLITAFAPYLGKKQKAAQDALAAATAAQMPLTVTAQQAQLIDALAANYFYNQVADQYNSAAAASGLRFQDLPQGAQTSIVDLAYQYGVDLARRTPMFWSQVTNGQWQAAHDNLWDFGDAYRPRRRLEADRLQEAFNLAPAPAPPIATPPRPRLRPGE